MNKAVFFDRDGVINKLVERPDGSKTAPWNIFEFEFLPKVHHSFRKTKTLGYLNFIVTNQPGIEEGNMNEAALATINIMIKTFLNENVDCIESAIKKNSNYYKPNNGMLEDLIRLYDISREESFLVGDRWKDIVAGKRSGVKTIFIGEEYTYPWDYREFKPDFMADNIFNAVKIIEDFNNAIR
jgi:D-glycero-D-manno-heptose 1,7-bisphosphate phosphatase